MQVVKRNVTERCEWANNTETYQKYHDEEWGVPVFDDQKMFEFLVLESAQAGLSWSTILKRREGYRKAFANFNAAEVAMFDQSKVEELMLNAEIIRNRLKIKATITNAQAFLKIQEEYGSFCNYLWGFVDGKPIINHFEKISDIPATTKLSQNISSDMKKRGFTFLGPTIIYAHLQATGLVNDHLTHCFRHPQLS